MLIACDANHLHNNHEEEGVLPTFHSRCLDPSQKYTLCMRKQVLGYTKDKGTELNLGMCGVMSRFRCSDIQSFCLALNGYCIVECKNKNYIRNRRVHSIIFLTKANVTRCDDYTESQFHDMIPNII